MSCQCGGCAPCQGFSFAVGNNVPWRCNQFGQIPPSIPCSSPSQGACSLRDANLACIANEISKAFFTLQASVIDYAPQLVVLETQKPLLIAALTDHKTYTCDPVEIFERDGVVSAIVIALTQSINELEDQETYDVISADLQLLINKINMYFDTVATWM